MIAAFSGAELMGSATARLFHDHVLVKEAGSEEPSPWHQDQPYYCFDGLQNISFWIPVDPVSRHRELAAGEPFAEPRFPLLHPGQRAAR